MENNAWDPDNQYWYPWESEYEALWVRPRPAFAITSVSGYNPDKKRHALDHLVHYRARALLPSTLVSCIGRRMAESPLRGVIGRKLGWLQPSIKAGRFAAIASPIFDWNNLDVWNVIVEMGWDWNRSYMRMWQAGQPWTELRIGPLFGEEPSNSVHLHGPVVSAGALGTSDVAGARGAELGPLRSYWIAGPWEVATQYADYKGCDSIRH